MYTAGMFNVQSWEDSHTIARAFSGRGMHVVSANDAAHDLLVYGIEGTVWSPVYLAADS